MNFDILVADSQSWCYTILPPASKVCVALCISTTIFLVVVCSVPDTFVRCFHPATSFGALILLVFLNFLFTLEPAPIDGNSPSPAYACAVWVCHKSLQTGGNGDGHASSQEEDTLLACCLLTMWQFWTYPVINNHHFEWHELLCLLETMACWLWLGGC